MSEQKESYEKELQRFTAEHEAEREVNISSNTFPHSQVPIPSFPHSQVSFRHSQVPIPSFPHSQVPIPSFPIPKYPFRLNYPFRPSPMFRCVCVCVVVECAE